MKKFILTLFFLNLGIALSAQTINFQVTGKIVEETTKLPLEFVFVFAYNSTDSSFARGTVSNKEGQFSIDSLKNGKYYAVISLLGYDTIHISEFIISSETPQINLGKIYLKTSGILLNGAIISEDKSTFVSTIDRKIYYPEKDIQAQTGSASDVLQNVPSISVDDEGTVSLRGSANVTILINGKPSQLMNTSPAAALQQIPASSIERIEIITNPSAKYKPDGVAGIINIVLKKNVKLGFNGMITVNASTLDRYNGNLNMNYNTGKYNIYGSYGLRQNFMSRVKTDSRNYSDSIDGPKSDFLSTSISNGRSYSQTINGGLEYTINKNNSFSFEGSSFIAKNPRAQNITTTISDSSGTYSNYATDRNDIENETESETVFSFDHAFKKEDHEISFELGWDQSDELEESHYRDNYKIPYESYFYGHNIIRKNGNSYTAAIDYVNPIAEDVELNLGYEGEFQRQNLEFSSEYFDLNQYLWTPSFGKNNTFIFKQDVHAFYSTLSMEIDDFSFMGGLRAEQTFIISNLVTLDSIIPNNYFKLFPTAHFLYSLSDNQEISLSYSRRVNRPDPDELNPFPEYKDPRNLEGGNPNLKPEQTHSIELGYMFKNDLVTFIPSLYYHYTYDAFTEVTNYINDTVLLTTSTNLATDQSTGIELVFAWKYKKFATVNFSSNVYYNSIDASNLGYSAAKSNIAYDAKIATNFNLGKTTKFQLNSNYRSSSLTAQGHSLPVFFVNAGFRQELFKKRAAITITASDIFNTQRWVEVIDTPLLYQEVIRKRKSQFVFIGFSWKFGMNTKKSSADIIFDNKL